MQSWELFAPKLSSLTAAAEGISVPMSRGPTAMTHSSHYILGQPVSVQSLPLGSQTKPSFVVLML